MATLAKSNHGVADEAVTALLKLEMMYGDPPAPTDQRTVEALRGGAIVLMVAGFEQYLKESISEIIDSISNAAPPCDFEKLPDALKVAAVYSGLEMAMKGAVGDGSRTKLDRLPDVFGVVSSLHVRQLNGTAVAQTGGNPSPEQVKTMFKNVGIPNVLGSIKRSFDTSWGTPTSTTFVGDTLDSIVRRRHVVAHTASALSISRGDLAIGQRFLVTLISVLDAALERHLARILAVSATAQSSSEA